MQYNIALMRDDAIVEIQQSIMLLDDSLEWKRFKRDVQELCDNFLIIAAGSLLADLKLDLFFLNLCRSAENWRRYLVVTHTHYKKPIPSLLYNAPLYAGIVAGDQALLNRLRQAMPPQFQKGEEYQDQFCTSWLLLLLSLNGVEYNDEIKRYLATLADCEPDTLRHSMFSALLGLDDLEERDFWEQFEVLLYAYEETTEASALKNSTPIREFASHRFIWFEGLIWLKLAKAKGFVLPSDGILYCPEEALADMPVAYPNDWIMMADKKI